MDSLIAAHTERLRKLQLTAAKFGEETPPHVVVEIEKIEKELTQLKQASSIPLSDSLVEELGPVGRYQLWMSHIMRLDTDIGRIADEVEKLDEKFDQVLIALATNRQVTVPGQRRKVR